jgi:hypothetical protein
MVDITTIMITAILTAAIKEIVSLALKKFIMDKKWEFKFTFLKKKRSSENDEGLIIDHPNTPFTFDENHNFVEH